VDNMNSINTSVDIASDVGLTGARTYFLGVKKLEKKEFDKLWKVYTKTEWNNIQYAYKRPSSSSPNGDWWKDEESYLDLEKL
jgi:hypothetical protein